MHGCTRATFLNGPNIGSHFPDSVAILEAAQLQRVAAAINTGSGNVKGPSPLKQALRNASPVAASTTKSPPPPPAEAEEEAAAPAQGTPDRGEAVSPRQQVGTPAGAATPGATRAGRTPGIKRYEPGESSAASHTPNPTAKKPKTAPVKGAKGQGARGGKGSRGPYIKRTQPKQRHSASSPQEFTIGRGGKPSQISNLAVARLWHAIVRRPTQLIGRQVRHQGTAQGGEGEGCPDRSAAERSRKRERQCEAASRGRRSKGPGRDGQGRD